MWNRNIPFSFSFPSVLDIIFQVMQLPKWSSCLYYSLCVVIKSRDERDLCASVILESYSFCFFKSWSGRGLQRRWRSIPFAVPLFFPNLDSSMILNGASQTAFQRIYGVAVLIIYWLHQRHSTCIAISFLRLFLPFFLPHFIPFLLFSMPEVKGDKRFPIKSYWVESLFIIMLALQ